MSQNLSGPTLPSQTLQAGDGPALVAAFQVVNGQTVSAGAVQLYKRCEKLQTFRMLDTPGRIKAVP